jgi:hypothetical protein
MQYFPLVVLPTGFYALFSNPTNTKMPHWAENNHHSKHQKKSCSGPQNGFSSEIAPLICR